MTYLVAVVSKNQHLLEKNGPIIGKELNASFRRYDRIMDLLDDVVTDRFLPTLIVVDIEHLFPAEHVSPFEIGKTISVIYRMLSKLELPMLAVLVKKEDDPEMVKELMNNDIDGLIPRVHWLGIDAVIEAYRTLFDRKKHFPRSVINHFVKVRIKKSSKKPGKVFDLTPRQHQVLNLVRDRGASNKNIARILHISESTVKLHISAILKKYGATNRTQLVLMANQMAENGKT